MIPIRSESSARSSAPKPRPSRPLVDRSSRSLTNTRSDLPSIQTSCSHHRCSPTPIQATAPSMKPNQTRDRSSSRSDGRPVADLTRNWRSTWTAPRQQPKRPCVEKVTSRHSDVPNVTNGSQAPRRPTSLTFAHRTTRPQLCDHAPLRRPNSAEAATHNDIKKTTRKRARSAHRDRCCSSVARPVADLSALQFHAERMIRGCEKCVLSITTSTNEIGSTSLT